MDFVVLPEDRVVFRIASDGIRLVVLRNPGDLSKLIDRAGKTVVATRERAQVLQGISSPRERVGDVTIRIRHRVEAGGLWRKEGGISSPDDSSIAINDVLAWLDADTTAGSAKSTQVDELVMVMLGLWFLRGD